MNQTEATLTRDGLTVKVRLDTTEGGAPLLVLEPQNCDLEGIEPGKYVLGHLATVAS